MRKKTETSEFGTKGRISHDSSKFYNSKLYNGLNGHEKDDRIHTNQFPPDLLDSIMHGSSENMGSLPDNSVHLMITSPPYNVSKEYDEDLTLEQYLALLKKVARETFRVLVDGGRACINIANVGRKPYIPLSHHISGFMAEVGFKMRGEIIWNKGASASPSTAWGSWMSASNPTLRDIHEYILVFTKGDYKRDGKGKVKTITRDQFMDWTKSIWNMNAESARRVKHPAPFPVELPYRLIQLFSFQNDIILDPFIGSGTTAIAALKSSRKFIGFDTDLSYIELAKDRIKVFREENAINPPLKEAEK
jgi:DNA modification methylase